MPPTAAGTGGMPVASAGRSAASGTSGSAGTPAGTSAAGVSGGAGAGGSPQMSAAGASGSAGMPAAGSGGMTAAGGSGGVAGMGVMWAGGGTKSMQGNYPNPFEGTMGAMCAVYPTQTIGPCYAQMPAMRQDISDGLTGLPVRLSFLVVRGSACTPVPNASIDIWICGSGGI
jgi:hypothetical protein